MTVCTANMIHYLGEVVNDRMRLSEIGECLTDKLENVSKYRKDIEIPSYVVMPNHFHAIICINDNENKSDRLIEATERLLLPLGHKRLPILSSYIAKMKAAITCYARMKGIEFNWQSRYHDRAIRNMREVNLIEEYIRNNVSRWNSDRYNTSEIGRIHQ